MVEDHEQVRDAFSDFLRHRGLEVRTAGTLAEADRLLTQEPFDVILLDEELPDGLGSRWLERWITDGRLATTAVIIVTGRREIAGHVPVPMFSKQGALGDLLKQVGRSALQARQNRTLLDEAPPGSRAALAESMQLLLELQLLNDEASRQRQVERDVAPGLHLRERARKIEARTQEISARLAGLNAAPLDEGPDRGRG